MHAAKCKRGFPINSNLVWEGKQTSEFFTKAQTSRKYEYGNNSQPCEIGTAHFLDM